MSHIVSIKTEVRDVAAIRAACRRLNIDQPEGARSSCLAAKQPALLFDCPIGLTRSSVMSPLAS